MKHLTLNGLAFCAIISCFLILAGCEKEEMNFRSNELNQIQKTKKIKSNNNKAFWKRIKIKKGRNQHPNDNGTCGLSLPCGPCAGICIRIERPSMVSSSYTLSNEEIENGYTLIDVDNVENDNTIKFNFIDNSDLITEGYFVIEVDATLGEDASSSLGYSDVTLLEGFYEVNYSENSEGSVIVNVDVTN